MDVEATQTRPCQHGVWDDLAISKRYHQIAVKVIDKPIIGFHRFGLNDGDAMITSDDFRGDGHYFTPASNRGIRLGDDGDYVKTFLQQPLEQTGGDGRCSHEDDFDV